jgi:tRNA (Thr-GGU) A37 N-methylase
MAGKPRYEVVPTGWAQSPLTDRSQAPRQDTEVTEGIRDLRAGTEIMVLAWFDRSRHDVLVTRPGDNPYSPPAGVFSTRSPGRPNPIGLHRVRVITAEGSRVLVHGLEAPDGTPLADAKPVPDKAAGR